MDGKNNSCPFNLLSDGFILQSNDKLTSALQCLTILTSRPAINQPFTSRPAINQPFTSRPAINQPFTDLQNHPHRGCKNTIVYILVITWALHKINNECSVFVQCREYFLKLCLALLNLTFDIFTFALLHNLYLYQLRSN